MQLVKTVYLEEKEKNNLEYIIRVYSDKGGMVYTLSTTDNDVWNNHHKNKEVLRIKDTGNGLEIDNTEGIMARHKNHIIFDYSIGNEVYQLLRFISMYDTNLFLEYNIKEE